MTVNSKQTNLGEILSQCVDTFPKLTEQAKLIYHLPQIVNLFLEPFLKNLIKNGRISTETVTYQREWLPQKLDTKNNQPES